MFYGPLYNPVVRAFPECLALSKPIIGRLRGWKAEREEDRENGSGSREQGRAVKEEA